MDAEPRAGALASYDTDVAGWAHQQACLLREGRFDELDIANIAEEIDSVGRSERKELSSRLAVLLCHLLKWEFQAGKQSPSWKNTIWTQRTQIELLIADSSCLKAQFSHAVRVGYLDARAMAVKQTKLLPKTFPLDCPYASDRIMNKDFFPS